MNLYAANSRADFAEALTELEITASLTITAQQAEGGPGTQVHIFAAASETFFRQETVFLNARSAAETAQARVNSTQAQLSAAMQDLRAGNARTASTQTAQSAQSRGAAGATGATGATGANPSAAAGISAFSGIMPLARPPGWNPDWDRELWNLDLRHNTDYVHTRVDSVITVVEDADLFGTVDPSRNSIVATLNSHQNTSSMFFSLSFTTTSAVTPLPEMTLSLIAPDGTRFGLGGDFFGSAAQNTPSTDITGNWSLANNPNNLAEQVFFVAYDYGSGVMGYVFSINNLRARGVGTWQVEITGNTNIPGQIDFTMNIDRGLGPDVILNLPPGGPWGPAPPPTLPGQGSGAAGGVIGTAAPRTQGLWLQTGANANQGMFINIGGMDAESLGLRRGGDVLINVMHRSGDRIAPQLDIMDQAMAFVSRERSKLGAKQNRLEATMRSLAIASENLTAAESRIRDADMAKEMLELAKANILQQAAVAMLVQARVRQEMVLRLIG